MNTYINKLQAIIPPSLHQDKMSTNQKITNAESPDLLQKFIPVSRIGVEDSNLPVWQVHFEELKTTSPSDFCLEITGDIVLGVEEAKSDVINLSNYSNNTLGVSRRHLKISATETDLLMIDLGSTNGTRKNGRFVQPDHPYSIYNGDILQLGGLTLAVHIVKAPTDRLALSKNASDVVVDALTHLTTVLASNLDLDDVLDRIAETTINLCKVDEVALLVWDEQDQELCLRAERGLGDSKTQLMKVPMKQGYLLGEVLQTGKPLRAKTTNGQKSKIVTGYLVEAVLYIPISIGEDSIGILIATRQGKGQEFCSEDERLLSTIANFAAIAIRNSQKYEVTNLKLQNKIEELSSYNKIMQALSKANSLIDIYSALREQIRERWDVENIGLWVADHLTQRLIPFPKPTFHKSYSFGEELIGSIASRAEPLLATDIKLFSEPTQSLEPTLQLLARSAVCAPIVENNTVLGVLAAFSKKENEFDEEDLKWLQTLALAAAAALQNVRLFDQVDKQRATILAAVNMLPHPVLIVDQDEKIIVSNRAADALLRDIHASNNDEEGSDCSCSTSLMDLMTGLSESRWNTREITVGDKVYVATLEYASMVGTIIFMQDITDPVTGTFNRRHFQYLAEQAFQQAKRYAKPLSALMIGLENFEQVVHQQGHAIGNEILKGLADQLRGFLRTPDILGRYQEDKFIILLPETTLENARVVADRITKLSKDYNLSRNHKVGTTLRIGVAMLDSQSDASVEILIEKAYGAYATAKNDRNIK